MHLSEAANLYRRAGLSVVPARLAEKRPALSGWKEYQARLPTEAEISAWFANAHDALCLISGAVSGNLELIDFDLGGELFDRWAALVETEAPGLLSRLVIEQSQSGGRHAIYRCEAPVCGSTHLAQRAIPTPDDEEVVIGSKTCRPRRAASGAWEIVLTLIETRGEGGLFLCYPSPGYDLLQGRFDAIPVVSSAEREVMLEAAWSLNELVPTPAPAPSDRNATGERPGDAYNARGDVVALLQQHGWTLVRDGDNQHWRRPGKTQGWSATLKGRVFYVFSSNAAPFEQGRAYGPFGVYAHLAHGGDFARAASALRGQGFGSSIPPPLPTPPVTPRKKSPSIRQLIAKHPKLREPVLHGLLRRGETMNVISAPKVGKSWLVIDLALAVATGRPWLDTFQTERGDVLILDNELHGETSANRVPRVAEARGIHTDSYADHLFVENLRGRNEDVFSLSAFFESIEPGEYRIIILDAFYRFMPRDMDENDNGTMASIYNRIDHYAERLGCCFVLIHHTSKGSQSAKSVTDVGAGAGSQSRATDTHLVLRPHEQDDAVVLDAAVRSWAPVNPACLRWTFPVWSSAPELDPVQLRQENAKKRAEKKDEWTPDAFVEAFVTDKPSTRSAILGKAIRGGLSKWAADNLLRIADSDGLMVREGDGKRNEPFTYRRFSDASDGGEERP